MLLPKELFAITEIVPDKPPTVAMIEVEVEVPVQPVGKVQV